MWVGVSTALIIYWEKTSRLRHNSWNLKAYGFGAGRQGHQQVWVLHSYVHRRCGAAWGVLAPGTYEEARTSHTVPGFLALTSQPGRWTWKQTDSIKWRRDKGVSREHRRCAQEGSCVYMVECLLSGKRLVKYKTGEEGRRQINNHLLNASYASRCQTQG